MWNYSLTTKTPRVDGVNRFHTRRDQVLTDGPEVRVMATHLLLGHKSTELEGYTISLRPQPLSNLTNSSNPFPSHKVQNSLCQPQPVGCQQ